MSESAATAAARLALELAADDPAAARGHALEALALASRDDDRRAAAMAERGLGLAAREEQDLASAQRHLRAAARVASAHHLPTEEGEARMSLAAVLALRGRGADALVECDRAARVLGGLARARLEVQRATVLDYTGDAPSALTAYALALPTLRRHHDLVWLARLHNNRGMLHVLRDGHHAALVDLTQAEALFVELGQTAAVVRARHNLGLLAAWTGDVPAALEWLEAATDAARGRAGHDPDDLVDRSHALLRAGLVEEAREAAAAAVEQMSLAGRSVGLGEAQLVLADAALAGGDASAAASSAAEARDAFAANRHRPGLLRAAHVQLRADWLSGKSDAVSLSRARRTAKQLDAQGFDAIAVDAHLIAGRMALALGSDAVARRELHAAAAARQRGPAPQRARGWFAEGLLRLARGDRRGADSALRRGIDVVATHRATLGATDLRARAAAQAVEIATTGLRMAVDDGRPAQVLAWAERGRAGSLNTRQIRAPRDAAAAAALDELRAVGAAIERAAQEGRDTTVLGRRQAVLEATVRRRDRLARGAGGRDSAKPPTVRALANALGDRALVELVDVDGTLLAVSVVRGTARLLELGSVAQATSEVEALRFAVRRLALGRGSAAALAAAAAAADHGARALDSMLLAPLGDIGDRPLVIVPTGALHVLPWGLLPSCRGRAVTVAPSAGLWAYGPERTKRVARSPLVLVAGPGLPGAAAEIAALAADHGDALVLTGADASARAVAGALDGARLAHIAAHGRFRTDNPLLSSLVLSDGQLTVYDLEGLKHAPRTVVLSSCESGLSTVHPGDELMGFAASLFALGTSTMIASVAPVPDDAASSLMVGLHRALDRGAAPAAALATAQSAALDRHPAVATFVCFGQG